MKNTVSGHFPGYGHKEIKFKGPEIHKEKIFFLERGGLQESVCYCAGQMCSEREIYPAKDVEAAPFVIHFPYTAVCGCEKFLCVEGTVCGNAGKCRKRAGAAG